MEFLLFLGLVLHHFSLNGSAFLTKKYGKKLILKELNNKKVLP